LTFRQAQTRALVGELNWPRACHAWSAASLFRKGKWPVFRAQSSQKAELNIDKDVFVSEKISIVLRGVEGNQ